MGFIPPTSDIRISGSGMTLNPVTYRTWLSNTEFEVITTYQLFSVTTVKINYLALVGVFKTAAGVELLSFETPSVVLEDDS